MDKKKIFLIIALGVIILLAFFVYFSERSEPEEEISEQPEITVEEALESFEEIFQIGDTLIDLEKEYGPNYIDEEIFDKYGKIEDDFFRIRDDYFGEVYSEEELKLRIDDLIKQIEELEAEIINIG